MPWPGSTRTRRGTSARALRRFFQLGAVLAGLIGAVLIGRGDGANQGAEPSKETVHRADPDRRSGALPTHAQIKRAIDGDTVELDDGQRVRYIGIDSPETRRRDGGRWIEDPEHYAFQAKEANRRLVEGKFIRLEYDVQSHDKYGRLLAYVHADDRMVNEVLLEEGFANVMTVPPNVKYAERFKHLMRKARKDQRGLWAPIESEAEQANRQPEITHQHAR